MESFDPRGVTVVLDGSSGPFSSRTLCRSSLWHRCKRRFCSTGSLARNSAQDCFRKQIRIEIRGRVYVSPR